MSANGASTNGVGSNIVVLFVYDIIIFYRMKTDVVQW